MKRRASKKFDTKKKRLLIIAYINRFVLYFAFVKQIDVHLPCIQRRIKKNTIKDNFFVLGVFIISPCLQRRHEIAAMYVLVCVLGGGVRGASTNFDETNSLTKIICISFHINEYLFI